MPELAYGDIHRQNFCPCLTAVNWILPRNGDGQNALWQTG